MRLQLHSQRPAFHRAPPHAQRRRGLSLLEVVLALTILAMSAGILASITSNAVDNGMMGHRLATAQILAESKMAEVVTGAIPLQGGTGWTMITDPVPNGTWYYQIETTTTGNQDMIGIRLAITDEIAMADNAELFYVARWMIDPNLGLDTPPTNPSGGTGATNAGTGAAGGTSGGASSMGGGIQ